MKNILLLLSLLICLMACEKTIELNVPVEPPKLVMHAHLNPDSTFQVELSKSAYILGRMQERPIVQDATVQVFENDKLLGSMKYLGRGWYELEGVKPQPGSSYRIEAEAAGMDKISASEKVLTPLLIQELSINTVAELGYGAREMEINFSFDDPPGENFYIIYGSYNFRYEYTDPDSDYTEEFDRSTSFEMSNQGASVEDLCIPQNYRYTCLQVMNDALFDGQQQKVRLKGYFLGDYEEIFLLEESFTIYILEISSSYYYYYKALELNRENRYDPFAEPGQILSNVEGGYGILGAMTSSVHQIEL